MAWREELHPRDNAGRFARKGTLPAVSIKATLSNLPAVKDADLFDVFHRLSVAKKLDAHALRAIDAELVRREGVATLPPPDDTPEQKKVDDLVRRGWSYADAYADAYGVSGRRVKAQQESAALGRRPGETLETARRRAYAEVVALESLQAEEATRGHLLAKPCIGIDPVTLWTVRADRARRCASEELKRWWEANGGRRTYADWKSGKRPVGETGKDFSV